MIKIKDVQGLIELVDEVHSQTREIVDIRLRNTASGHQRVLILAYDLKKGCVVGIKADWEFELNNKAEKNLQAYKACKNYLTALLNGGMRC